MENLGNGNYRIDYYSPEYDLLLKVFDREIVRLADKGIIINKHSISVSTLENILVFYLHLYVESTNNDDLTYKDLFGNY